MQEMTRRPRWISFCGSSDMHDAPCAYPRQVEGWRLVRVEEIGEVQGGRQRNPDAAGTPRPYLRVANVFDGRIDTSHVLEMPFTDDEFARYVLRTGDVLLNEGQSLELV